MKLKQKYGAHTNDSTCSYDIQCMIGLQTEILVRSQMKSGRS